MATGPATPSGPATGPATGDGRTRPAIGLLVGGLAVYAVVRSTLLTHDLVANVVAAAAVGALAWWASLSADELGLRRDRVGAGLRWGGAVVGIVATVVLVAVSIPATRSWFDDDRVTVGAGAMAVEVLVAIPLGTVLLEELSFRGVLLGLLRRDRPDRHAVAIGSLLFGLWHVAPALTTAGDNAALADVTASTAGLVASVAATVVATAGAGVALCWLRLRADSLVAPVLVHWAINGLTFAAAWAVHGP